MTYVLAFAEPGVLVVRQTGERSHVEVRGAAGYEVAYHAADPLHALLDRLDPHTVSTLFAAQAMTLNDRNPRHAPSFEACAALIKENP